VGFIEIIIKPAAPDYIMVFDRNATYGVRLEKTPSSTFNDFMDVFFVIVSGFLSVIFIRLFIRKVRQGLGLTKDYEQIDESTEIICKNCQSLQTKKMTHCNICGIRFKEKTEEPVGSVLEFQTDNMLDREAQDSSVSTKKCINCGNECDDKRSFCNKCWAALPDEVEEITTKQDNNTELYSNKSNVQDAKLILDAEDEHTTPNKDENAVSLAQPSQAESQIDIESLVRRKNCKVCGFQNRHSAERCIKCNYLFNEDLQTKSESLHIAATKDEIQWARKLLAVGRVKARKIVAKYKQLKAHIADCSHYRGKGGATPENIIEESQAHLSANDIALKAMKEVISSTLISTGAVTFILAVFVGLIIMLNTWNQWTGGYILALICVGASIITMLPTYKKLVKELVLIIKLKMHRRLYKQVINYAQALIEEGIEEKSIEL
jgi:hypothetical protein